MNAELEALMEQYWSWLKEQTEFRQIGEWIEITTPYVDRHNDYLQIYVGKFGDNWVLTDDGYIIRDLEISGCELKSKKRQDFLKIILNGFGVRLEEDSLIVHCNNQNFPIKKHNLLQAMIAVNDMFYLASSTIKSLFFEDVAAWLKLSDVRFIDKVKFTGKSSLEQQFDFVIPASPEAPERFLQAINYPSRQQAKNFAFAWIDTRETRNSQSRAYAVLNDSLHCPKSEVIDAFQEYEIKPVLWSQRESIRRELVS